MNEARTRLCGAISENRVKVEKTKECGVRDCPYVQKNICIEINEEENSHTLNYLHGGK